VRTLALDLGSEVVDRQDTHETSRDRHWVGFGASVHRLEALL